MFTFSLFTYIIETGRLGTFLGPYDSYVDMELARVKKNDKIGSAGALPALCLTFPAHFDETKSIQTNTTAEGLSRWHDLEPGWRAAKIERSHTKRGRAAATQRHCCHYRVSYR